MNHPRPVIKRENGYQLIASSDGKWNVYTHDHPVAGPFPTESEARAAAKELPANR